MSATYTRRADRGTWLVTVTANHQRERIKVASEQDAKELVRYVHKAELAGQNIIDAIRTARQPVEAPPAAAMTTAPRLRDVLPEWLEARPGPARSAKARPGPTASAWRHGATVTRCRTVACSAMCRSTR